MFLSLFGEFNMFILHIPWWAVGYELLFLFFLYVVGFIRKLFTHTEMDAELSLIEDDICKKEGEERDRAYERELTKQHLLEGRYSRHW